jgi:hypothetical protein
MGSKEGSTIRMRDVLVENGKRHSPQHLPRLWWGHWASACIRSQQTPGHTLRAPRASPWVPASASSRCPVWTDKRVSRILEGCPLASSDSWICLCSFPPTLQLYAKRPAPLLSSLSSKRLPMLPVLQKTVHPPCPARDCPSSLSHQETAHPPCLATDCQ